MKHSNREDIEADWQAPRNLETPTEAQEDLDDDEVPGNRTTRALPCCILFTAVVLGFVLFGWKTLASVKDVLWQKVIDYEQRMDQPPKPIQNIQEGLVHKLEQEKALLDKVGETQQKVEEVKEKVDAAVDAFNQPTP